MNSDGTSDYSAISEDGHSVSFSCKLARIRELGGGISWQQGLLTTYFSPLAQPYIAIDWEPEMRKRYYDEVKAQVTRILGIGDTLGCVFSTVFMLCLPQLLQP